MQVRKQQLELAEVQPRLIQGIRRRDGVGEGQETTVRTGHGTTNWFQIGKGIHQGCMRNTGLDEAQAGIKTAGRNINYL